MAKAIDSLIAKRYHKYGYRNAIKGRNIMLRQGSDFELELMKIIWENDGTALYAEIVEGLDKKDILTTKNTIISLLLRLIEKDFLKTNKIGRRNKYTVLVSEEEYQAAQTESFLNKIYEGDAKELISTLIQKDLISADEYEELKKHWKGCDRRK